MYVCVCVQQQQQQQWLRWSGVKFEEVSDTRGVCPKHTRQDFSSQSLSLDSYELNIHRTRESESERESSTKHQLMLRSVTYLHFLISVRDSDRFKLWSHSVALKRKFSRCWCVANISRCFHFSLYFDFILTVLLAERVKNTGLFVWAGVYGCCGMRVVIIIHEYSAHTAWSQYLIKTKCFSGLIVAQGTWNVMHFLSKWNFQHHLWFPLHTSFIMAKCECLTPSQFPTHIVTSLNLMPHDRKPKLW